MIFPEEEKAMPSYLCELSGGRCWTELSDASISISELPEDDFLSARMMRIAPRTADKRYSRIKYLFLAQRYPVDALARAPYASKPYFAVNEATCAKGCASAHAITSCELV